MELQAIRRGIKGIVKVGRKHITFVVGDMTSKVGEIDKRNGKYEVAGILLFVSHENRAEAIKISLNKAGFKINNQK